MRYGPVDDSGISQLRSVACTSFTDGPADNLQCAYREKSCSLGAHRPAAD